MRKPSLVSFSSHPGKKIPGLAFLVAIAAATTWAQALSISTVNGELHIKAPAFGFIEGAVMERLKDGRTVQLVFDLVVLARSRGAELAQEKQAFNLSLDLWETRLAVTRLGKAPRSVSHLRPPDAEAWCLDNLAVPLSSLGTLARDTPFWLKLSYRVDPDRPKGTPDDSGFTLQGLIDRLSRRGQEGLTGRTIEAGPFRLSN